MITSGRNIAVIEIGESGTAAMIVDQLRNQNQKVERYFFEAAITEFELDREINDLQKFYDLIIVLPPLPYHIREAEVQKMITIEGGIQNA